MIIQTHGSRDSRLLPEIFRHSLSSVGSIQVLEIGYYSVKPFRSEVRKKKKTGETVFLIEAVYEMIDKRAITPVTSLESYSYSLFLGNSKE